MASTVISDKSLLDTFGDPHFNCQPFPRDNLLAVLEVFRFNMQKYPSFSDNHKVGLFHMMLNLVMANDIINDRSLTLVIREILSGILLSFTDEEWSDMGYRKVLNS